MPAFARSLPADHANTADPLPARAAASAGSAPSPFAGQVCPRCNGSGHARVGVCRRCQGDGWLVPRRERARAALMAIGG